jgi:hypothetical protein
MLLDLWAATKQKGRQAEADALFALLLFMVLIGRLVRLSAVTFGKFFERRFCVILACIWGAADRAFWFICPVSSDNRALIALALMHDVIVLPDLWVFGVDKPSAAGLQSSFRRLGRCRELQHRCGKDNR